MNHEIILSKPFFAICGKTDELGMKKTVKCSKREPLPIKQLSEIGFKHFFKKGKQL